MGFRFTLEPVLRVARIREEQELAMLRHIQVELARMSAELAAIVEAQSQLRNEMRNAVAGGVTGAWMNAAAKSIETLGDREVSLKHRLREVQGRMAERRRSYTEAQRPSEMLEQLRKMRLTEYERGLQRQEQAVIDDLFLNRYR